MEVRPPLGLGTLAVHLGTSKGDGHGRHDQDVEDRDPEDPDLASRARASDVSHGLIASLDTPLVLSAAFHLGSAAEAEATFASANTRLGASEHAHEHAARGERFVYGRWGNPTIRALETLIAGLEGGAAAAVSASGMAAISGAILTVAKAGDRIVAPRALYGETARLLREKLPRFGIETTFLDDGSVAAFERAIAEGPAPCLVYLETPSNPTLSLLDIAAISELAHRRGALVFVDNTFATPYCQRPLSLGADLVLHSMTKFLCGHGDAIAGAAIGNEALVDAIRETTIKNFGAALSPFSAHLIARGIRTFVLRMERATRSAATLAAHLSELESVNRVYYPGLPSHPGHTIAKQQMLHFPAIFSFDIRGGREAARAFVDAVRLATHAVSLGDVRTLITHPASTTASTMPVEDRARVGITDSLLRVAVGIEDEADLRADLCQALAHATGSSAARTAVSR
jgi:methionine-gamma-lyase